MCFEITDRWSLLSTTLAVDDQTCERWSEFLKGPLLDHNKICETNLVCSNNGSSSMLS